MSTAVYLRISRDRLGLELGVDRQRADCADLCQRRGWPDPAEYVDNDISATTGRHRPGYAALIEAVKAATLTRVVVWHPSRLWRNRAERAAGIELFKQHRVTLACVKGPELDFSTAYGRLAADLIGAFDSSESEVKSERETAEVKQRAEQGRYHGGYDLFGFHRADIIPEQAEMIRGWAREILAGGSARGIATRLNQAGVPSATGGSWQGWTVVKILRNPRMAGLRVLHGVEYPAPHPPILPPETWRAVCDVLDPAKRGNRNNTARRWLGTGLYVCAQCAPKTVKSGYHSDRNKRVYRCVKCWRCWQAERLDRFVAALIEERLSRGDLADLLPADRPDLSALRLEAQGIRQRLKTLAADFVTLGLDAGQVAEANRAGRERLAEIEAQLGDPVRGSVLGSLAACDDPVKLWRSIPAEDLSRRQAIVRAVMTITLEAPPRGRRWDPDRFVVVGPPTT